MPFALPGYWLTLVADTSGTPVSPCGSSHRGCFFVRQGGQVKNFTILTGLAGKNSVFRKRYEKCAKKLPEYAIVRQIVSNG